MWSWGLLSLQGIKLHFALQPLIYDMQLISCKEISGWCGITHLKLSVTITIPLCEQV